MKYSLLAVVVTAVTLTACGEYKKHPMDKPPPSASVERDSAPNFDELDKPSTDEADSAQGAAGSAGAERKESGK